ncbi:TELO2-interacting protein 1 homolog [Linum grandiflorum]
MEDDHMLYRSSVFSRLKPYCLELLQLLQNPNKVSSSALPSLLQLLRSCSSSDLQSYFDYTSFPLLLLLDTAVSCRSSNKDDPQSNSATLNPQQWAHSVSDKVAEGVLQCLEELLQKCHFGSVDQMVVVMKKLTNAALLSPSEASEEFREGVIKCLRNLLKGLSPCADETCSCRQTHGMPALLENVELRWSLSQPLCYVTEVKECIIAFLQSDAASAAIGHLLSLLLKAADGEAARGHRGSARLRVEAFYTLRVLVAKVGTADALAFFLPGVVSQFSKVLHGSKTMMSGAAGSTDATDQAVRALAEYLMIVLDDDSNVSSIITENLSADASSVNNRFGESILDQLRHLPVSSQGHAKSMADESIVDLENSVTHASEYETSRGTTRRKYTGSLHVERTREWLRQTSAHVVKLLSATFPHICVHPVKKLRWGLLDAIKGLISRCSSTLKECRSMLLECLFVLVVDDSEDVAGSAQEFLEFLFSSRGKHSVKADIAQIFARIIEKLPKVVLGGDESVALFHARQLLVVIYYSGPQFVLDHLQNPVTAARLLDVFSLCLSPSSVYAGALDKVTLTRTSSISFLPSIMELRCASLAHSYQSIKDHSPANVSDTSFIHRKQIEYPFESHGHSYELPRMPPWFVHVGCKKLYDTLAGVFRLVGLSLLADHHRGHMAVITDVPLSHIHRLVSEVRSRDANEDWQYWYNGTWAGKLIRQASTSACILNEMIFGVSDKAVEGITMLFQMSRENRGEVAESDVRGSSAWPHSFQSRESMASVWKATQQTVNKSHLIDCIGRVLHEYISFELRSLPIDIGDLVGQSDEEVEVNLHLLQDAAALQQVAIDGIGIFAICLGNEFSSSGFLHSTLYLLLESLISADIQVRTASDAVLHVLSSTCGHSTVGELVLANADYVVDSICRQLRHLDLNPQVPNVLASMLSYIGVTHKVLPLLEETMGSVSRELEILSRHQHPELTTPFLKAIAEICKASKSEASSLPCNAAFYLKDVKSKVSRLGKKVRAQSNKGPTSSCDDNVGTWHGESEQWEGIIFKLNESKRYRRTVGSIAASCLLSATPLLASKEQAACLVALDIVQNGIESLAKVEEAYRHEKETKEVVEEAYSCNYELQDTMDAADEGIDENRLLPAMNKIWPFLICCVRNNNPVAVRKCASVIANVVQTCGGDFFTRRFHTDGPCLWKLLSSALFQKKALKDETRRTLRLPYRSNLAEESMAETSKMKVQAAVLNMVADLARSKRSCTALEVVLKKVSGLVVGIACSGVIGLHDASVSALDALATMDPDLIWLLVADVYYSSKEDNARHLPPASRFLQISRLLPPPRSPKEYLYVQYGGQSYGFDINMGSVEKVFRKLQHH